MKNMYIWKKSFGIEMICIPMNEDGPDMDMVEKYVNNDAAVKGIWCVPKYTRVSHLRRCLESNKGDTSLSNNFKVSKNKKPQCCKISKVTECTSQPRY